MQTTTPAAIPTPPLTLERYLTAARHHGEDSDEPDHEAGDLIDMLRAAWAVMTPAQRVAWSERDDVAGVLECGERVSS